MAATASILRSLGKAVRRDLGTFRSIQVNNFFLFVYLLIYGALVSGVRPASSYPFLLVLSLLLLCPLSSDPMARIPPSRLGVWPLGRRQRVVLRVAAFALNPAIWLAGALAVALRAAPLLLLLAVPVGQASRPVRLQIKPLPLLPHLVRNHLRQLFTILDTWLAIVISIGGTIYRLTAKSPDVDAFPILAMLVALALSTYTQCLFSLDGRAGIERYRLLPLHAWQILGSKDAAWLVVLCILTAPLRLSSGLAFGLAALAIGHWPSTRSRLPMHRWRFAGGRVAAGAAQMVIGATLGFAAARQSAAYVLIAAAMYAASFRFARNMREL